MSQSWSRSPKSHVPGPRRRRRRPTVEVLERRELLSVFAYITGTSDPWNNQENDASMNAAFGAGNWDKLTFNNAVNAGILQTGKYQFLYVDGGDGQSQPFEDFINANRDALQTWVSQGGRVFLNAARWTLNPLALGFGATLNHNQYDQGGFSGQAVNTAHPIFQGPHTGVGTSWKGNLFAHDYITGDGLIADIVDGLGRTILAERAWGTGLVVIGGMTTANFDTPHDPAADLRTNTLVYGAYGDPPMSVIATGNYVVHGLEGNATAVQTVATFRDAIRPGPVDHYLADIDWGDGGTSTGQITFDPATGVFTVSGSHRFAEESAKGGTDAGRYVVHVTIHHSFTVPVTVTSFAAIDDPAAVVTGSDLQALEGRGFSHQLVATFTDPGGAEDVSEYAAAVDWGDGTTSTGVIVAAGTGFQVYGDHTYREDGDFTVETSVTHDTAPAGAGTATAHVADAPLTATGGFTFLAAEGQKPTAQPLATFTDQGGPEDVSRYSADIFWGDETGQQPGSSGTIQFDAARGVFTVFGSHAYAADGPFTIRIVLHHGTAPAAEVQSRAAVVRGGYSVSAVEGLPSTAQTLASFTDPRGAVALSEYSARVVWGDGGPDAAAEVVAVTYDSDRSVFVVRGSHVYADEGDYTLSVTLLHGDAPAAVVTSTAHVADAALHASPAPLSAAEGAAFQSALVASFTDDNPSAALGDFTATIDWGDGTSSSGVVQSTQGGFRVLGGHTYAEDGQYTVKVTILDKGGSQAQVVGTATVADVPVFATGGLSVAATEGILSDLQPVLTFTDPGGPEVLAKYSADIAWGDGTTSAGTITFDAGSGRYTVRGAHTYAETGTYDIRVTVHHGSAADAAAVSHAAVGDAALHATGLDIAATEGAAFTDRAVASFTDDNPGGVVGDFRTTIDWGDGTASAGRIVASGGGFRVLGSHTYADEGTYTVKVQVTDVDGATANATSKAQVGDAALHASAVTVLASEGLAFQNQLVATFTDDNPSGVVGDFSATIDWGDGSSSAGTIAAAPGGGFRVQGGHTYADDGSYSVTVKVLDKGGSQATAVGSATVADVSVVATGGRTFTATEGAASTLQAVLTFTDPGGPEALAKYSADIAWGDGTASAGTITFDNGTGRFTVSGAHTYAEAGGYDIRVTVHHGTAADVSAVSRAVVGDAALHATGIAVTATEGAAFTDQAVASFTDDNPGGVAGDFVATINWGDGSTSAGKVVAAPGGGFRVLGNHSYADEGSFSISVRVDDVDGSFTTATTSASVADPAVQATAAGTFTASEGTPSDVQAVATFTDPGGPEDLGQYSAAIAWGDGATSVGTIAYDAGSQRFTVLGSHTFARFGSYAVRVTIRHAAAPDAVVSGQAVVADVKPTVAGVDLSLNEGAAFQGTVVATFTDASPTAAAQDFTASVDWGDGQTSVGTVQATAGGFRVLGGHTYADEGRYTITVTVNDVGGASGAATAHASVADVSVVAQGGFTLAAVEGAAFTDRTLATFTDPGGPEGTNQYRADVDWGDGSTSAATITFDAKARQFSVLGTHAYAQFGSYQVKVTVHHGTAGDVTVQSQANVVDAPLTGSGLPVAGSEGAAIDGATVAQFQDANPNGTADDFQAQIDWGDGKTSAGTVVAQGAGFAVTGSHTYAEDGSFRVTVRITDRGGSTLTLTGNALIADVPVQATGGASVQAVEGTTFTGQAVATFTDPAGAEDVAKYGADIAWGDGTTSRGTIGFDAGSGQFTVRGGHTYATAGSYTIHVTVHHGTAADVAVDSQAVVAAAPLAVTGVGGSARESFEFHGTVASFVDTGRPGPLEKYRATIDWGDGSDATAGEIVAQGTHFLVVGRHTYADNGNYGVHVTVRTTTGAMADATATLAVAVVPPTLALAGDPAVDLGVVYTVMLSAHEFGTDPILHWTINWGDGSLQTVDGDPDSVTHVYNQGPTRFTVSATATDQDGSYAAGNTLQVVIRATHMDQVATADVQPGETATAALMGAGADEVLVAATLSHGSGGAATMLVATYKDNPVGTGGGDTPPLGGLVFRAGGDSEALVKPFHFYDLNVRGGSQDDFMQVTFSYPADTTGVPTVGYYDAASRSWVVVHGSTREPNAYVIDAVHHTITVKLDDTSTPTPAGLHGTVFTVAVSTAQPTDVGVVAVVAAAGKTATPTVTDSPSDLGEVQTATFASSSQLTLGLSASHDTQLTSGSAERDDAPRLQVDAVTFWRDVLGDEEVLRLMAQPDLPAAATLGKPAHAKPADDEDDGCDNTAAVQVSFDADLPFQLVPLTEVTRDGTADLVPVFEDAGQLIPAASVTYPGLTDLCPTLPGNDDQRLAVGWALAAAAVGVGYAHTERRARIGSVRAARESD